VNSFPQAPYTQGCQMVYYHSKNPNLGVNYWVYRYFITISNILRPFGVLYGNLVWFVVIWYIFPVLVCLDQEKSGNPAYTTRSLHNMSSRYTYAEYLRSKRF
jgi:hypothetical protein